MNRLLIEALLRICAASLTRHQGTAQQFLSVGMSLIRELGWCSKELYAIEIVEFTMDFAVDGGRQKKDRPKVIFFQGGLRSGEGGSCESVAQFWTRRPVVGDPVKQS
jgi:hypothetical protein